MAILSDVAPRTLSLGPIEMIYVNIHPNLESVCRDGQSSAPILKDTYHWCSDPKDLGRGVELATWEASVETHSAALGSTDLSLATATDSKSKKPGRKRKQKRGRKKKDAQTAAPGEAGVAPDSEARGPDGKSKPRRGRPCKSDQHHPVEEQAGAQVQRKLPDRNVKVEEEVTSIEVGAKNYSRSTGCRESAPSMYDIDYRKGKRASQQERASPAEVEVGAGQLLPSNQLSEAAAGLNIDGNAERAS
ncbi:hypothetical protein THAOC_28901, partial [Thalassiosira oceanica]